MKLIMTLLVKNEEHIIEENLIFHKAMGVDAFIVTDNSSTDKTLNILEKYIKKGWILKIIHEPSQNYNQFVWVNRMINIAIKEYKADWVINADADEFWCPRTRNFKNILFKIEVLNSKKKLIRKLPINVLNCYWKNMLSDKNYTSFWENIIAVEKKIKQIDEYNLSKWNLYQFDYPKVIHKAKGFISIKQGNHEVDMINNNSINCTEITIYHFSIQNYKHFERKIITGGKAYEQNITSKDRIGAHWKYWFKIWKENALEEEYSKIIGSKYIDDFIKMGIVKRDYTIYNFFNQLKK